MTWLITLAVFALATIVSCVLHELGHAIGTIVVSRVKATVVLGTSPESEAMMLLRSRWLDVAVSRNPLLWAYGYCRSHAHESDLGRAVSLAAGPILPVIVGAVLATVAIGAEAHWVVTWFGIALTIVALMGMAGSLHPRIDVSANRVWYSDGYQLRAIVRRRRHAASIARAEALWEEGRFRETADLLVPVVESGVRELWVYRLAAAALAQCGDDEGASRLCALVYDELEFQAYDYAAAALVEARLGNLDECIAAAEQALERDPANAWVLCNRGFALLLDERYDEAVADFDRAIAIEPQAAYPYANRGLARIRRGLTDDGLADIRHALELDPNEAYAHRNLGIYHLERGDRSAARACFERATSLDPHTHMIDHYLGLAR